MRILIIFTLIILISSCAKNQDEINYKFAMECFKRKDYANAMIYFNKVDSSYEYCNRYEFLAASQQNLKFYEEAIKNFEKARSKCDPDVELLVNLSDSYYKTGNLDSSIKISIEAYKMDSTKFQTCFNLGLGYKELEEYDIAYYFLKKAYLINPDDSETNYLLAEIHSGAFEYDSSLYYINNAIKTDNNIAHYITRSTYYAMLKDFGNCIKDLNYVIQMDSLNESAFYNRAHAFYNLGKTDEACKDYRVVKRLNPESDIDKWVKCK